MTSRVDSVWLSGHVGFEGTIHSAACDRVLLDHVAPCVQRLIGQRRVRRFFFIRYSEDGPHVRLRLEVPSTATRGVRRDLARATAHAPPGAGLSLTWIPYEPETERYGGRWGVHVSEDVFQLSSEVCLELLRRPGGTETETRFASALLAMIVLVRAFLPDPDSGVAFFESYAGDFLRSALPADGPSAFEHAFAEGYALQAEQIAPYVAAAWSSDDESFPGAPLDRYDAELRGLRERILSGAREGRLDRFEGAERRPDIALNRLLPSYAHMMHNRLGLSVPEEAYIAYTLHRALRDLDRRAA